MNIMWIWILVVIIVLVLIAGTINGDSEGYTAIVGNTMSGNTSSSGLRYDPNSYDTQYHQEYPAPDDALVKGNIVYYQPGSFRYGPTSYVPYYEDSVYLSRSANAVVNAPSYVSSATDSGFCNYYKSDPDQLEAKCNTVGPANCAATTCCVLLGGQKCVAGNENGPTMKANYSDFLVLNKDFYYYQGKCYGNCPNTSSSGTPPEGGMSGETPAP